jgi:hypothetical protein
MKRIHVISIFVCLGIAASAAAGDLWINCDAGFDIYLDGELAGVSDKTEFGKRLPAVSTGKHIVRIEKDGVVLAEFSVDVAYAASQVVVGELSTGVSGTASEDPEDAPKKKPVGTITITSDPRECNVKIANQRISKIEPIMTFPNITVGEHKLWFESSGTVLKETVRVLSDQPAKVMVDFRNQRVVITGGATDPLRAGVAAEEEGPQAEPDCIEYWIQVLRTNNFEEIKPYQQTLKELGFPREHHKVITVEDDGVDPIYKLRIGPIERLKKAKWAAGLIRNAGLTTVWVLPEECQPHAEKRRHELRPDH